MFKRVIAFAMVFGCLVPASAGAADQIGQIPATAASSSGCTNCSLLQTGTQGGISYVAPYDGVISEWYVRQGSTFGVVESVSLEIWRPTGGGNYQLILRSP